MTSSFLSFPPRTPDMRLGYWAAFSVGCILKFASIDPKSDSFMLSCHPVGSSPGFHSVAEFKEFERTLQWFRAHDCIWIKFRLIRSDHQIPVVYVFFFWSLASRFDHRLGLRFCFAHLKAPLRHRKPSIDAQLLQGAFGFHADRWAPT